MFPDATEIHDYNLRNKYVLQTSVARTQSGDTCMRLSSLCDKQH